VPQDSNYVATLSTKVGSTPLARQVKEVERLSNIVDVFYDEDHVMQQ
jgi:hypothetical protein